MPHAIRNGIVLDVDHGVPNEVIDEVAVGLRGKYKKARIGIFSVIEGRLVSDVYGGTWVAKNSTGRELLRGEVPEGQHYRNVVKW